MVVRAVAHHLPAFIYADCRPRSQVSRRPIRIEGRLHVVVDAASVGIPHNLSVVIYAVCVTVRATERTQSVIVPLLYKKASVAVLVPTKPTTLTTRIYAGWRTPTYAVTVYCTPPQAFRPINDRNNATANTTFRCLILNLH